MDISRRHVLGGGAALSIGVASPRIGRAQSPTILKCGNNIPPTHPINIRLAEAAERVRRDTDGQIDIQIFPSNQLGSDTDMLSQVRSGGLDLMSMPGVILATLVPASSLNSVGFAFSDYPTVWKAMDGDVGRYIRAQIGKANLVVMDRAWDNGFRQITTRSKAINTPQDLADLKLRVPVSPLLVSVFKALNASPTSINVNELYSSLQTRIVDGQENPLPIISNFKFYEVQKHCAMTRHVWNGYWQLANRRSWSSLPTKHAEIVARHLDASAIQQRADSEQLALVLRKTLTEQGMAFSDPDQAPFREKLRQAGFYRDWRQKFGDEAWGTLEAATGQLG